MTERWFQAAFGAHYPLLYAHRDESEARRCLDLLPRLAPLVAPGSEPSIPILDLGCGDGRHLADLAGAGIPAIGVDLSAALLETARDRLVNLAHVHLVRGDMRSLPLADRSCAGVLSLFTAFGYFDDRLENRRPVAEVSRVLVPGGHWFLDYFDVDRVKQDLADGRQRIRERTLEPLQVRETRWLDTATSRVCKEVCLTPLPGHEARAERFGVSGDGLRYTEQVALYELAELDDLATSHGLLPVASAGSYEGEPLGTGDRWILVFRKEGSDNHGDR